MNKKEFKELLEKEFLKMDDGNYNHISKYGLKEKKL